MALSIPPNRPPLHFSIDRFHALHIHQRCHTRLKNQPHQVRLFDSQYVERLQPVVWVHQKANDILNVLTIAKTLSHCCEYLMRLLEQRPQFTVWDVGEVVHVLNRT